MPLEKKKEPSSHTLTYLQLLVIHFDNSLKIVQEMPRQVKKPPATDQRDRYSRPPLLHMKFMKMTFASNIIRQIMGLLPLTK